MIEVVSSKLKKDGRFHLLFIFIVHVQDLKQLKRTRAFFYIDHT